MCCMNTGYSTAMGMYTPGYRTGMYGYNQGMTGMYSGNLMARYTCNMVNVIDMSGMITKRMDCTPTNTAGMYTPSGMTY